MQGAMDTTPVRPRRSRRLGREHTPIEFKKREESVSAASSDHLQADIVGFVGKACATSEAAPPCAVQKQQEEAGADVAADRAAPEAGTELAALVKCFDGLELVLHILALRGHRALLPRVRADVELHTRKSLTDDRLARILTLSQGMIKARWWIPDSAIELEQLTRKNDGETRAPTLNEMQQRRQAFMSAALAVRAADEVHPQELPKAPVRATAARVVESMRLASQQTSRSADQRHQSVPTPMRSDGRLSAAERMEQFRARVRAREAAGQDQVALAISEIRRRLNLCDNAIFLHPVVAQLFSRNDMRCPGIVASTADDRRAVEISTSSTSEEEVVSAVTSQRYAVQATRRLEPAKAREALAHLALRSCGWFVTEEGVYNVGSKFLRRLSGSSSSAALAALQKEQSVLRRRLDTLMFRGPCASAEAAAVLAEVATGADEALPNTAAALPPAAALPSVAVVEAKRAHASMTEAASAAGVEATTLCRKARVAVTKDATAASASAVRARPPTEKRELIEAPKPVAKRTRIVGKRTLSASTS